MNWRQRLTQNLFYGGLTREDYLRVRDTVLEHNRSSVVVWCFVLGGFWIYSLLMSMGSEAYANCRMAYAGGLACCVFALYGAAFVAPNWKWIRLPLIVFFDIAFLGASIGIAVFQPDVRTITMFVAVIIVPICYIERTILTIILLLINLTAYIFIAKGPIEPEIYSWGLGNLIIFSTGGMLKFVRESAHREFIIGTECGILHRMKKENPEKEFYPLEPEVLCPNMKRITLEDVLFALRDLEPRIEMDEAMRRRAKTPIDRMLEILP